MFRNILLVSLGLLIFSVQTKSFAQAPPPPTNLQVTDVSPTRFIARWTPSPGATSYRMDLSTSPNFSTGNQFINKETTPSTPNAQVVNGVTSGATYYFRVRAVNANGTSANSVIRSLVMPPFPPTIFGASEVGETFITINWSPRTGANEYRLDVSKTIFFDTFVYSNISAGNNTGMKITKLTPGTQYFFRVRAVNSLGASDNSDDFTDWTALATAQVPVALPATNVGIANFTANWHYSGSLNAHFKVEYSYDPTFKTNVFERDVDRDTTVNISLLTSTTTYYRVRSINPSSFYSNVITVQPSFFTDNDSQDITIYPNPVRSAESLNVDVKNLSKLADVKITITNLNNDASIQYDFKSNEDGTLKSRLPVSSLKPGTYILKVNDKTSRFIIN